MRPELVLMRIPLQTTPRNPCNGPACSSPFHSDIRRAFTGVAQWDWNHAFHLGALAVGGVLETYTLQSQEGGAAYTLSPSSAYQLHLLYGGDWSPVKELAVRGYNTVKLKMKAVDVQLGSFEFIPGRPHEIIFFQVNSTRILFASLPGIDNSGGTETESSKVFCVGRHASSILCISVRSDGLAMVSTAYDGSLRVWRLSDGSLLCETNVAYEYPAAFYSGPFNEGATKGMCSVCGEEMRSSWSYANVLLFVGLSWGVAMGCMDGICRLWTMAAENLEPDNVVGGLQLTSTKTLISSSTASISALAVHAPDALARASQSGKQGLPLFKGALCPRQQQNSDQKEQIIHSSSDSGPSSDESLNEVENITSGSTIEYMAAGNTEGGLMVWTRYAGSHGWTPAWSKISADVSIACLSFRADGGLLAAGASMLWNPSPEALLQENQRRLLEQVHLYETSSWSCVGSLSFKSRLVSCSFYHPGSVRQGYQGSEKNAERERKLSSGMLLICTSDGPETHLIPDFETSSSDEPFKKIAAKTVRWADTGEEARHTGRLYVPMSSPRFFQHFQRHPRGPLTDEIKSMECLEGGMGRVDSSGDNESDSTKVSHESSKPCQNSPSSSSSVDKKVGKSVDSMEDCNHRKVVQKPGWDKSIAKFEVGYRIDIEMKSNSKKEPHILRLKGGIGQDVSAGPRKKKSRDNALTGHLQEENNGCDDDSTMPEVHLIKDNTMSRKSRQVCSPPASDHNKRNLTDCQECYHQSIDQLHNVESTHGDQQKSNKGPSCCPKICQSCNLPMEGKSTKLQGRICSGEDACLSHAQARAGKVNFFGENSDLISKRLIDVSKRLIESNPEETKNSSTFSIGKEEFCPACLLPMREEVKAIISSDPRAEMCYPLTSCHEQENVEKCGAFPLKDQKDEPQKGHSNEDKNACPVHSMENFAKTVHKRLENFEKFKPCASPQISAQMVFNSSCISCSISPKIEQSGSPCLVNESPWNDYDKCKPCAAQIDHQAMPCSVCKTPIEAHDPRELQWCCASLSGSGMDHKNDKKKEWCGIEHVEEDLRKVCQHLFQSKRASGKECKARLDSPNDGLYMDPIPCHDSLQYDVDKCQVCHHPVKGHEQVTQGQELQTCCESSISSSSRSHKNDKEKDRLPNVENDLRNGCQLHPCVQPGYPKTGCDPSRDGYQTEPIDCQTADHQDMCLDCQHPMKDHKRNIHISQDKETPRASPRCADPVVDCMTPGQDTSNRCLACLHLVGDHGTYPRNPHSEEEIDICVLHNQSPLSVSGGSGSHNRCSDLSSLSDPLYHQLRGITAAKDIPEEIIQRYQTGRRVWAPRSKKQSCVGCKTWVPKESKLTFPVHSEPHPLRGFGVKPKPVEMKKLRFCTGLHRGKGDVLHPPVKGKFAVLPVLALSRDATKGVWSRRAFRDEWECGHAGCCSQHWVSVLNPSKKVCHSGCQSMCEQEPATSKITPHVVSTAKFLQKLHAVRAEKFHPKVATSLLNGTQRDIHITGSSDYRSSPSQIPMEKYHPKVVESLSKLPKRDIHSTGSIGHRSSQLQTPRRIMEGTLGQRSTCCSSHRSSPTVASRPSSSCGARSPRAVLPAFRLQSPELNSSTRLLAKVQDLHKESFDQAKVMQMAEEKGLTLNKDDEMELRKHLRGNKRPDGLSVDSCTSLQEAKREGRNTRQLYSNLSNIFVPHTVALHSSPAFAPRKVPKPFNCEQSAMRRNHPSISDLWVASDQCPQVCSKGPLDLNPLNFEQGETEESKMWAERESACREAQISMNVYDSCCM